MSLMDAFFIIVIFFLSAVFILMPVSEETLTNFNKSGIKNVAAVCQFAIPDNRANII